MSKEFHGIEHSRSQGLIDAAYRFAAKAHGDIDHRRKYTDEPYIVHPVEVAQLVASVTEGCELIAAAFLHDVLEDTPTTFQDLMDFGFGYGVAKLVDELTDVSKPEDGNRATRKAIDRFHTAQASPAAKTVKLADLISNSRSIVEHDPDFARVYMREKKLLLDVLTEGDSTLHKMASDIVDDYYRGRA